ncbi:MAG: DUF3014 domain-containing protein [Ketobacteraceae bacterium]|nr:DUF3014 domain-containing protein [Ketobacteraceae bacterium]
MRSSFPIFTATAVLIGVLAIAAYLLLAPDTPPVTQLPEPEVEPVDTPLDTAPDPGEVATIETLTGTGSDADAEPAPEPPQPDFEVIAPPETLDDSDTRVKEALVDLAPGLTKWLVPEEQVRKWVLAVDMLADGRLPKRYRPMIYPMDKFKAKEYGDISVMEDANYERLSPLLDTVTSINVDLLAAYYRSWRPLLEQAYRQQGEPGTFEERLVQAIDRFLKVQPLKEKGVLVRPHVFYEYQDEALEEASDIEKLVWRMGEENANRLKDYARAFKEKITRQ